MHLLPHLITISHHRHVGSDDCRDARILGRIYNLMHQGDVLAVDDGVHRQIALDTMLVTLAGNVAKVVNSKSRSRVRPHVQLLNAEIDGVGPRLNGCRQRLVRADGCHYLKICYFFVHGCKITKYFVILQAIQTNNDENEEIESFVYGRGAVGRLADGSL